MKDVTPGKWMADGRRVLSVRTKGEVAKCGSAADARLIASVPQMLNACIYAHNFMYGLLQGGKMEPLDRVLIPLQAQTLLYRARLALEDGGLLPLELSRDDQDEVEPGHDAAQPPPTGEAS